MPKFNIDVWLSRSVAPAILTLSVAMFCVASRLGAQNRFATEVDAYRPLAAALDQLESATGIPIHYEDAPVENQSDLETISHPRAGAPLLVARRGVFSTEIDVASARIDPSSSVQQVVGAYTRAGLPGHFRVSRGSNGDLRVLPSQMRGASGENKALESPLSPIITLPSEERSVIDTFAALLKLASEASGKRIDPGAIPIRAGRQLGQVRQIRFGATRESARDALTRLIRELWENPVSYRLLYDPMLKYYMLNLQPVIAAESVVSGPEDSPSEIESPAISGGELFVPAKP